MKLSRFLIFGAFVSGCSGSTYAGPDSLVGTYSGTYTGNDNGSIVIDVDSAMGVKLSATSSFWHTTFSGTGSVNPDAHLSGTGAGGLVSITFVGSVGGGVASGTWTASNGATGSWTSTRN
jgi:hypothetical protein